MTMTITISTRVEDDHGKHGYSAVIFRLPDNIITWLQIDRFNLDLPGLIRAAHVDYKRGPIGKQIENKSPQ